MFTSVTCYVYVCFSHVLRLCLPESRSTIYNVDSVMCYDHTELMISHDNPFPGNILGICLPESRDTNHVPESRDPGTNMFTRVK